MKNLKRITLTVLVAATLAHGEAPRALPQTLDLNSAIELAIAHNPGLKKVDAVVREQEGRIGELLSFAEGGQQIDEAKLQEVLAREAAVQRKR